MITKNEAGILLAIIDESIPYIPIPHSRELAVVARSIKGKLHIIKVLDNELKMARRKLERKIQASQNVYNRLLEENRHVADLKDEHSFHDASVKPKRTMRKYVVRLDNGDTDVDFLLENKSWRDFGNRVCKWMEIPDDEDRLDETKNKALKKKK